MLEETCFQQADLLQWKVPARLYWDVLTSGQVPAGLSLFLKTEKTPALLYAGKGPEYRPFMISTCSFGLLASTYLTSQEEPVLRPFSYT
jgi:hypothetical protein